MPAPEYARLTIDFDLQADPIAGVVHEDGGRGQPFAGWMALTRAIEIALDAARRAAPDGPADIPSAIPADEPLPRQETPR